MCAAAHGWVGLGRIVYVVSSEQLTSRLAEEARALHHRFRDGSAAEGGSATG